MNRETERKKEKKKKRKKEMISCQGMERKENERVSTVSY